MIHLCRALLLGALAVAGCAPNLKAVTSGRVGCPEAEIDIVEEGDGTWTAVCRGQTYYCSTSPETAVGTVGHNTVIASSSGSASCTQDITEAKMAAERSTGGGEDRRFVRSLRTPYADAPAGALGFLLGATAEDTKQICVTAQLTWSGSGDAYTCAGTPKSVGLPASSRIRLCQGKVCEIVLISHPTPGDSSALATNFATLSDSLKEKYGDPNTEERKIPPECRSSLGECVKQGTAFVKFQWIWSKQRFITLAMRRVEGDATIELVYKLLPDAPTQKIDHSAL